MWNYLRTFVAKMEKSLGDNSQEISGSIALLIAGIIILPVFAAVAFVLSFAMGPFIEIFLLLLGIRGLKHVFGFLSLSYGTATLNMHLQSNKRAILTLTLYASSIYYLFGLLAVS